MKRPQSEFLTSPAEGRVTSNPRRENAFQLLSYDPHSPFQFSVYGAHAMYPGALE
jgi:hypothetical protein